MTTHIPSSSEAQLLFARVLLSLGDAKQAEFNLSNLIKKSKSNIEVRIFD
jgi:hypothetical protein